MLCQLAGIAIQNLPKTTLPYMKTTWLPAKLREILNTLNVHVVSGLIIRAVV